MTEHEVMYDHPRPIVCTCGHAFGVHDRTDPLIKCTRCPCDVYITDWDVAHELGYEPAPHQYKRLVTARTRWMQYRKQGG
jgi:hypothetical protein